MVIRFFLIFFTHLLLLQAAAPPFTCVDYLLPDKTNIYLSSEQWNRSISEAWYMILKNSLLPKNGTVVEVAPGNVEKIGLALSAYGFQGSIYVIEPHAESLKIITEKYKKLLPNAQIIPLEQTLSESLSVLPNKINALLSNHPLDDMLVGKFINSKSNFDKFFSKMYEKSDQRLTSAVWSALAKSPQKYIQLKKEITDEWISLIKKTNPEIFIISQYHSMYHNLNSINEANQLTADLFTGLKEILSLIGKKQNEILATSIQNIGQNSSDWILYSKHSSLKATYPNKDAEFLALLGVVPEHNFKARLVAMKELYELNQATKTKNSQSSSTLLLNLEKKLNQYKIKRGLK